MTKLNLNFEFQSHKTKKNTMANKKLNPIKIKEMSIIIIGTEREEKKSYLPVDCIISNLMFVRMTNR